MNTFGTSLELVLRMAARDDAEALAQNGRCRALSRTSRRGDRGGAWWSDAVRMWVRFGQTFTRR